MTRFARTMSSFISNSPGVSRGSRHADCPIDPQLSCHLFRLPPELRLTIYEYILPPTKARSLYLTRDVCTWSDPKPHRKFLKYLLVCRRMTDEALDILYSRHELLLYTSHWALQTRVGGLQDYTDVLQRAHRVRLTLFVSGGLEQDNVLVALLSWLKAVLAEREKPLKLLTLEFCAIGWKLECQPTAVLYSAQGFRSLGPTKFRFQCGFSGVGSESAMEALMQHANDKIRTPSKPVSKEEAFEKYLNAWKKSRPQGLANQEPTPKPRLTACRYMSKVLGNRRFKTRFEI